MDIKNFARGKGASVD